MAKETYTNVLRTNRLTQGDCIVELHQQKNIYIPGLIGWVTPLTFTQLLLANPVTACYLLPILLVRTS